MSSRASSTAGSTAPTWLTPPGCSDVLKYGGDGTLHRDLNKRVSEYFKREGLRRDGGWRMIAKSAVIVSWVATTYVLLLTVATEAWHFIALAISMGLSLACVGFSIQHDGGHGAYSNRRWVSKLAAFALDAIGGSSYMWHHKHNVLHHTYPNIEQVDDDISQSPWLRLSTTDAYHPAHRYQHVYSWLLYALVTPKWIFVDDYRRMFTQRAGARRVPPPRGKELAKLFAGKALAYSWMFITPLVVFGPSLAMLAVYGLIFWVWGLSLATTFQLAHCNDIAEFGSWPRVGESIPMGWAEQQLATTVNFSQDNRALTWFLGGLNYQIEHHLFPKVCHLHYPAISSIVAEVCAEHGAPYLVQPSMFEALRSHIAHLKRVGAGPSATEAAPAVVG